MSSPSSNVQILPIVEEYISSFHQLSAIRNHQSKIGNQTCQNELTSDPYS